MSGWSVKEIADQLSVAGGSVGASGVLSKLSVRSEEINDQLPVSDRPIGASGIPSASSDFKLSVSDHAAISCKYLWEKTQN